MLIASFSTLPEQTAVIRRATARLCLHLGWSPLHEMPFPNGRRADILALRGDGGFACIEIKSGARDFLSDAKWPEYRDYCDAFYFAVNDTFPLGLLPGHCGLIVTCGLEAELIREPSPHPLAPARRRALLHQFATMAALRLAACEDPAASTAIRHARRVE